MINTNSASDNSPTTLKLYSFNSKQLIDKFHDQMVDYLKNNSDTSNGFFKNTLAISRDFKKLKIGNYNINSIGIRPDNIIKQGNRSISEFATHILQLYVNYLQREKEKQSKMDFAQISHMLDNYGSNVAMFSAKAYVDWIVNNLNKLPPLCVSIHYIDELNASTYFLKRLTIRLDQVNHIDGDIISNIVDGLLRSYQIRRRENHAKLPAELFALSGQLLSFTRDATILHQKFTNLAEMDYSSLLELFKLTNITTVTLPLVSIFNIKESKYLYKDIDINFYVANKEDLEDFTDQFINRLCNSTIFKDIVKRKIVFCFKDYQKDINNQIKAIHDNFCNIQRLKELTNVLSFLLENSIYDDHNFVN